MKGLSLCGGGSKGAYEFGAWTAFRELRMSFDVITGTSIGSLNGAMMVQDDYDACEELWSRINMSLIMTNGFELDEVSLKNFVTHKDFKPFIKDYIKRFSTDITPFRELSKDYIFPDKIKKSKIKFGIIISTFPKFKKVNINMDDILEEEIVEHLIASSSAFPVFPVCKINGKQYVDGGFTDNLPINLAFDMGATNVVAVDLREEVHHKQFLNHPCVDYIYPKWHLGSFLYFHPDIIERNKKLGYYDTMKFYGKFDGFRYTFKKTTKYDKESLALTLQFTKDFIYFTDKKLKNQFKREDYVNIYSILNKHINGKQKNNDYLIKCIEEIGFIFNVCPTEVYDIKQFKKIIIDKIKEEDSSDLVDEFQKQDKDSKKIEFLEECEDKKLLVNFLYKNEFDDKFKYLLMQTLPEIYICYVYLKSL